MRIRRLTWNCDQGIKTITDALYEIHEQSSYIMDKGDVLGAGRRLERINMAAHAALKACERSKVERCRPMSDERQLSMQALELLEAAPDETTRGVKRDD